MMETDNLIANLFNDIKAKQNVKIIPVDEQISQEFKKEFSKFSNKLFFEFSSNCGGVIVDDWVRLYGSGLLNIIEKNKNINKTFEYDILIGEDICGGIFALKENVVYYFAPDTLNWESLKIDYSNFIDWLLNNAEGVSQFYEAFRWTDWRKFCKNIKLNQGISFYPQLCFKADNENRSKKIININEIINLNFDLKKKLNI